MLLFFHLEDNNVTAKEERKRRLQASDVLQTG